MKKVKIPKGEFTLLFERGNLTSTITDEILIRFIQEGVNSMKNTEPTERQHSQPLTYAEVYDDENPDYVFLKLKIMGELDKIFWAENDESKLLEPQKLFLDNGLELHLTCGAFPEQYEVFLVGTEKQVGYLRLRHGDFRVDFPDCGDETIYYAQPDGDGLFEDNERMKYLTDAMNVILKTITTTQHLPKTQITK